jgi:hypothetical protein
MARKRTAENNLFIRKSEEKMRQDSVRGASIDRMMRLDNQWQPTPSELNNMRNTFGNRSK